MRAVPLALAIGMAMLVAVVALVSGSGPVRRWREGVVLAPKEEAFQQADAKTASIWKLLQKPTLKYDRASTWCSSVCTPLYNAQVPTYAADYRSCVNFMNKMCKNTSRIRGGCNDTTKARLVSVMSTDVVKQGALTHDNLAVRLGAAGYVYNMTDVNGLPYKLQ